MTSCNKEGTFMTETDEQVERYLTERAIQRDQE